MLEADTELQTALPMSDVALIPKNTDHHYVSQSQSETEIESQISVTV